MTYIETLGGKKIDLLLPDHNEIDIDDIACALSHIPRFAGHTTTFYSVAAHSINVAKLVPNKYKLQALLHDATEAYIGDMPTPFKALLGDYRAAESRLWNAVCRAYSIPTEIHKAVHDADAVMLMTERDKLKPNSGDWGWREELMRVPLDGLVGFKNESPIRICEMFTELFHSYKEMHNKMNM